MASKLGYVLTVGLVFVLISSLYIFNDKPTNSIPLLISVSEARSRRFGLIIDIRTQKERETLGYYPNSIPIALETIQSEVPLDISNKNTWILVYSQEGGVKARLAAETLYRMGYPNVRYIHTSYLSLMPGSSY